ncbi:MAG: RelA/SpoT family protein [Candidatus Buchananbacteria bacterium]|nr:RelA/SpoT family protein [Candidatus Buchananbacteria bacterium]
MINQDPQQEFEKLLKTLGEKYPDGDLDMVKLAYEFAYNAHLGQKRRSGSDYIIHPLATAQFLAELKMDIPTIIAGLLHDVPEDTAVTIEDIKKNFGKEVAILVAGITKLGALKYRGIERYAENLRRMFVAMSNDIRVILIKFADRINNLKTLEFLPPEKQIRIATESLEIYAPIADRLGIGKIKGELEDLSFKYVYPEDYKWIMEILPKKYKEKERYLEKVKKRVARKLLDSGITLSHISIHGRTKHLYSLYKKLLKPQVDRDLSKIYDLIALRIIVPTVADCYSTLGILHNLYRPMPGRVKDYIAQPKPNGYQSLHTTVFTENGEIVEFQIRTNEMHEEAEFGIAAHWNYKENKGGINKRSLKWIEELVKWQKQTQDNEQFLNDIKLDIFQNRIFVFTPTGDVIDLPEESTPIDFAYHVHSSIGNQCVGARVNDNLVSLNSKLKSGDIVEIITDKNRKMPGMDWLENVKTSMAKGKIRSALNKSKKL